MDSLAKRGRLYLLVILSAGIGPLIASWLPYLFSDRTLAGYSVDRLNLFKYLIGILFLSIFVYRGDSWAKWGLSITFFVMAFLELPIAFTTLAETKFTGILLIFKSIFLFWSTIFIHTSKAIQSFFEYQQNNECQ